MLVLRTNDDVLDFNASEILVAWDHEDNEVQFTNQVVQTPGGEFLDTGSETTLNSIGIEIISVTWDAKILKNLSRTISKFCLDAFGVPKVVWLYKDYESGFRRVKLSSLKTNFSIQHSRISLEFTPMDRFLYGELKTETKESVTLSTSKNASPKFNKHNSFGAFVDIEMTGCSFTDGKIFSIDKEGEEYSFDIGSSNSNMSFNNKDFQVLTPAGVKFVKIPIKFRYYDTLIFTGKGTINALTITYREVLGII